MKQAIKSLVGRIYRWAKKVYQDDIYDGYRRRHTIARSFRFNGDNIHIYGDGSLQAGDNSYIGSFSAIQLSKGTTVRIGKNCRISHNVRMYTSSAIPDQDFNQRDQLQSKSGDIVIGDAAWIGVNVFIGPGVVIGENAVVGANCVVVKDIPSNTIVGGIPARTIREKKLC